MIAVFMRNLKLSQLRSTLFVLWFFIVTIKVATLVALELPLNISFAVAVLPAAAVGHVLGLKAHTLLMSHDGLFRRVLGAF